MINYIKTVIFMTLTVTALVAARCGALPESDTQSQPVAAEPVAANLKAGEKLQVVATTTIIGDLVKNVSGNLVDLTIMIPVGADPHTFAPTPRDAASVANADAVIVNGLGLEAFLDELVENAGGNPVVVPLAEALESVELAHKSDASHDDAEHEAHHDEAGHDEMAHEEAEHEAHHEEAGHDEDHHHHAGGDPHVWLNPANVIVMVEEIAATLSELDPANSEAYQTNADAYKRQLEELDRWVETQVSQIPAEERKLVTDHDSFNHFASRYDFEIVGAVLPNFSTNAEPSAQELAQLEKAIDQHRAKAVFVGTTLNATLAERMAGDTGIQLVRLYTGSLGNPDTDADSYINYIRYNTNAIVQALK